MRDSAFLINHELRSKGFSSLAEAGQLIPQMAMCVRDDRHFAALLNACEPEERRHMYDALAPNIRRFKPRPFADYLIELAQDAERRQLPVIGEDGQLYPYKVPEANSAPAETETVERAVVESLAKEHLHVVCLLCTREEVVDGITKEDAVAALRKRGWRMGMKLRNDNSGERDQVEICPACVRKRAPRRLLT